MAAPVIIWFRQDLRLADQAAVSAAAGEAARRGCAVLPVYVLDDDTPGRWAIGAAQRWWLHHSLAALDASLSRLGSRLLLRRGRSADTLLRLADETGAARIHALRHYEPWWAAAEAELAGACELVLHDGGHLAPPEEIRSPNGAEYRLYSPFRRALLRRMPPPLPAPPPERVPAPAEWPAGDRLADWRLLPTAPDWAAGFGREWTPGEAGGKERLAAFRTRAGDYAAARDLPSCAGSSRLSPHLHFGEVSPAAAWHAVDADAGGAGADKFAGELAWRDFAASLIRRAPRYGEESGRRELEGLPWRSGASARSDLLAWQRGRTGYPIVDAGMRQLWATGWMHNRVRMITASFLVKHLLIDWRVGERWFWDTLVDADFGNNSVNWQWVAGTGAESSPFVRIMSPVLQSHRFDAGEYIRRWVPELAQLHDDVIHDPHEADAAPADYPPRLIEHRAARRRALAALAQLRRDAGAAGPGGRLAGHNRPS